VTTCAHSSEQFAGITPGKSSRLPKGGNAPLTVEQQAGSDCSPGHVGHRLPGCIVSSTSRIFSAVGYRRRCWTDVITSTRGEEALIGVHGRNHRRMPMPYRATLPVRSKRGAVHARSRRLNGLKLWSKPISFVTRQMRIASHGNTSLRS
jgi:hypothetical protein